MHKPGFSRRRFLERVAKATTGIALSSILKEDLFAETRPSAGHSTEPFVSGKKFVPVMLTPYTQNGRIDFDALSRLTDFYLAAGAKGFFANCLSSEMYNLSPEERLALARHTVKQANGRVSVVATGSFGDTLEEKAEFTKKMHQTGVDGVIQISSHFAAKEEGDDILFRNFERFCGLTGNIPLGIYECPSPYKRILTPSLFKSLLDTRRLVYHKDTSIDFKLVKAKLDLIKGNPIEFYDAHTPNTIYSLQAGAKGMSAIAGNFYPEMFAWMCNHATDPSRQEDAKWLQSELTRADAVISDGYSLSAKYFLQKRGLRILSGSRANPGTLKPQQQQALDEIHNRFLSWCERLSIKPAI
ncbi:MAG: dihydrodipicolinate synthase family protein [Puia sp.]|nr:dihydrodipicolinate synthase family protein [Puia sp.]